MSKKEKCGKFGNQLKGPVTPSGSFLVADMHDLRPGSVGVLNLYAVLKEKKGGEKPLIWRLYFAHTWEGGKTYNCRVSGKDLGVFLNSGGGSLPPSRGVREEKKEKRREKSRGRGNKGIGEKILYKLGCGLGKPKEERVERNTCLCLITRGVGGGGRNRR